MEKIIKKIDSFREDRKWNQFHNEKDLSISLMLEASELLENFQWKTSEEAVESNFVHIKDELADVFMYAFMIASNLDLDVEEIIMDKIEKNNRKYPISKSKGRKDKYDKLWAKTLR